MTSKKSETAKSFIVNIKSKNFNETDNGTKKVDKYKKKSRPNGSTLLKIKSKKNKNDKKILNEELFETCERTTKRIKAGRDKNEKTENIVKSLLKVSPKKPKIGDSRGMRGFKLSRRNNKLARNKKKIEDTKTLNATNFVNNIDKIPKIDDSKIAQVKKSTTNIDKTSKNKNKNKIGDSKTIQDQRLAALYGEKFSKNRNKIGDSKIGQDHKSTTFSEKFSRNRNKIDDSKNLKVQKTKSQADIKIAAYKNKTEENKSLPIKKSESHTDMKLSHNKNKIGERKPFPKTLSQFDKPKVFWDGCPKEQKPTTKKVPFNQDKALFQLHSKPKYTFNQGKVSKLPMANEEDRWMHRVRLAIAEGGGSTNPKENQRLKNLIVTMSEKDFAWKNLKPILNKCGMAPIIGENCFLLQIKFYCAIDLICCVRTENLTALKKALLPLLRDYHATFDSVIHNFNHACYIDALASYRTPINFSNFESILSKDAIDCHAKAVEIIDYTTGSVHFECHPLQLAEVAQQLESKNYRILYTDYGLSPINQIEGSTELVRNFKKFKAKLLEFSEIERIVDNLREPNNMKTFYPKQEVRKSHSKDYYDYL